MKALKFLGILCITASIVGCGKSWNGPVEITLTNDSTVTCEKSAYIDTSGGGFIHCFNQNGLQTTIPWRQVAGLRKVLSK